MRHCPTLTSSLLHRQNLARQKAAPRVPLRWASFILSFALSSSFFACSDGDVGTCCNVGSAEDEIFIPQPDAEGDVSVNDIRQNPAFDCDSLTCVSFQGSKAFCTARCDDSKDCPEGFQCAEVLTAEPSEDAEIQPEDKFCVRAGHVCN